jgi:type VI protein secretion system component Hcp
MILLRLDKLGGRYCDIQGGQEQKYGYNADGKGWMPIESMTFGFQSSSDSKGDAKTGATGTQASGRQGTQTGSQNGASRSGGAGNEAFTEIQVSRFVDAATPQLMKFAMQDRRVDKGKQVMLRKADIHFLHSVMGNKSETTLRTVFPYLMITLEDVLVTSWNITASGDDRPTESLSLKYDKAAMRYYRTVSGEVWTGGTPAGWNQMTNGDWTEAETSGIEFFKEPKKT